MLYRWKIYFFQFIWAFLAVVLAISMILNPQATYHGASQGLKTWVTILIPSLLPFFIIADLLVELGVVSILGRLLEPIMRPFFKQPGEAGFVLALGITSGFPMGAILSNKLYEKNICNRAEAEHLISFTNNSSPLFLLVAIPIGMFNNPSIGVLLAISHYLANILLGILLSFFVKDSSRIKSLDKKNKKKLIEFKQKFFLGDLLRNSIQKSINNIILIGGFVIFFSVVLEVLKDSLIMYFLSIFMKNLLLLFKFSPQLVDSLTTGLFEMTLGIKKVAQTNAPQIQQLMITSLILGWSGLSIQAQVIGIASRGGIPVKKYILGRFLQAILACLLTGIFYVPFTNYFITILPVLNYNLSNTYHYYWYLISLTLLFTFSTIIILIILSLFSILYTKIKQAF